MGSPVVPEGLHTQSLLEARCLAVGPGRDWWSLIPFPKGSVKLWVPISFPEAARTLGLRGREGWFVGSGAAVQVLRRVGSPVSLSHCCFSLAGERLKGQEEELASAVGSAKQEGSDSD